jgi:hypothetical protein
MSSNHIPHLLTRLMTESELDALRDEMAARAIATDSRAAAEAWLEALYLLSEHRAVSLARRRHQSPSTRRKSLSYRPQLSTAHNGAQRHGATNETSAPTGANGKPTR